MFQDLLSVLHSVALSHSPLTVQATPDDIVQIDHVTVAMVAIAYVLRLPEVGGVILGTLNMRLAVVYFLKTLILISLLLVI